MSFKLLPKEDLSLLNEYLRDNNTCKRELEEHGYAVIDAKCDDCWCTAYDKETDVCKKLNEFLNKVWPIDRVYLHYMEINHIKYVAFVEFHPACYVVNGNLHDSGDFLLSYKEMVEYCNLIDGLEAIPAYQMYSLDLALDYIYSQDPADSYLLMPYGIMLKSVKKYLIYKLRGENKNEVRDTAEEI